MSDRSKEHRLSQTQRAMTAGAFDISSVVQLGTLVNTHTQHVLQRCV